MKLRTSTLLQFFNVIRTHLSGSVEGQQSTKKKQLSHDSSSHKYRKGTSVKTITLTDLGATVTEKLSSTQKQKKLTINVISAANINRFGSASTSPVKRVSLD